jgi:hypothetical protein
MSLTGFVKDREVRARFAPLRAAISFPCRPPVRVPPPNCACAIIGTAFDYMVRFELKRRAPHAVEPEWLAESAHRLLELSLARPLGAGEPERVGKAVTAARLAVAEHRARGEASAADVGVLAAHALRLAAIDSVRRAGKLDPDFDQVDTEGVADLVALWAMVPWDELIRPGPVFLNPTFRYGSARLGGADADLVSGDTLIDFKVVRRNLQASADVDQLLGYFLVAREEARCDPGFPAIARLGWYLARHGLCWVVPAEAILSVPDFAAIESWFWDRAADRYPVRRPVPLPTAWPDDLRPPLNTTAAEPWAQFVDVAATRPDLGLRWGWPAAEAIRGVAAVLAQWAAAGQVPPRRRLTPLIDGVRRDPVRGQTFWSSFLPSLAPGTAVSPGQYQTFRWDCAPNRPKPGSLPNAGVPADFPGLIDYYPQAAWDYFLKVAADPVPERPAPSAARKGRRT